MIQRTLVVLKPDTIQRKVAGEIISRFERLGYTIIAAKMMNASEELLFKHYEGIGALLTRKGQKVFDLTSSMMRGGPVFAMVLEGIEAIDVVRKVVGPTEPKSAAPGTIRGDYATMSYGYADANALGVVNLVHASATVEEAEQEIPLWFNESEFVK
ncbi:MAG: nucleoside-diphosphate kinase [Candidatus Gracilibacteria bacterium]|nr:nucleoside-diphosphate kinase [Candidatus Gracilibacteria bacterium]